MKQYKVTQPCVVQGSAVVRQVPSRKGGKARTWQCGQRIPAGMVVECEPDVAQALHGLTPVQESAQPPKAGGAK